MKYFNLWILNHIDRLNTYQSKRIDQEAIKLGIKTKHVVAENFEIISQNISTKKIYHKGELIDLPDAIMTRQTGMNYFSHALLRHLEQQNILVINTSLAVDNAEDKSKTMQLLASHKIPIPESILVKPNKDTTHIKEKLGLPVVIKTIFGAKGEGVFLCENEKELIQCITKLTQEKHQILAQKFIAKSRGTDLRVFVVGNKAIGCVQRTSANPDKQFKANVSIGGTAQYVKLNKKITDISIKSSQALGLDISGVDLLIDGEDYKVCEVNSSPSFEGFETDAHTNVPFEILNYILQRKKP